MPVLTTRTCKNATAAARRRARAATVAAAAATTAALGLSATARGQVATDANGDPYWVWTGPGTATDPQTGNWNNSSYWLGGIPASAASTELRFGGANADAYNASNDLGPFTLNELLLNSSSSQAGLISGGQLNFAAYNNAGTIYGPTILQAGTGAFTVANNLSVPAPANTTSPLALVIGGTGSGAVTLAGNINFGTAVSGTTVNAGYLLINNSSGTVNLTGAVTLPVTNSISNTNAGNAFPLSGGIDLANGTLNISGAASVAMTGGATSGTIVPTLEVGGASGQGVLNLSTTGTVTLQTPDLGGTVVPNTSATANPTTKAAAGAIYQSNGTLVYTATSSSFSNFLSIGSGYVGAGATNGGYGAYILSGGTLTANGQSSGGGIRVGAAGPGVYLQSGGNVYPARFFMVGTQAPGVATFTGGTFNNSAAAPISQSYVSVGDAYGGSGTLNIGTLAGGNAQFIDLSTSDTSGNGGLSPTAAGFIIGNGLSSSPSSGTVNLDAGVLGLAGTIGRGYYASSATVNLDGGTIRALANGTTLINSTASYPLPGTVYPGGVTVDTQQYNSTISAPLVGATGSGIAPAGGVIPVGEITLYNSTFTNYASNTGYIAPPLVTFIDTSSSTANGATGIVNVANGAITGITITSPGQGYSAGDNIQLNISGGQAGTTGGYYFVYGAYNPAGNEVTPNAGGGLTKGGTGTLTLNGADTYSGPTVVNAGTLLAGSAGAIPAGTVLNVSSGATVNFNGKYRQTLANTGAPALTLGGLNAAANSVFTFNVSGGSADDVGVSAMANVASGAMITLALPSGNLTPGNYTLFSDANGGLSNFTLSQANVSSGGTTYGFSLAATPYSDVLTIVAGGTARYYYTGQGGTSTLGTAGNFAVTSSGTTAAATAPSSANDVVFSATNVNTADTTVQLGTLTSVNALEFSSATPITINGSGTLSLAGGAVSFNAGTGIVIDAGAAVPTIAVGLSLPQTTTFIDNAGATTAGQAILSGVIAGTGSAGLVYTSTAAAGATGAFNVSGASTYTGPTNVTGGAMLVVNAFNNGAAAGPLGMSSNASSNLIVAGGQLVYAGAGATSDRGLTFGIGADTINVSNPAATLTLGGATANASGSAFVKAGNGALTLTASGNALGASSASIYAGTVTLPGTNTIAGTLNLGNNAAAVATDAGPTLNLSGGTTTVSGTTYVGYYTDRGQNSTANLTNGATFNSSGTVYVGYTDVAAVNGTYTGNQGVLSLSGGSHFTTSSLYLGNTYGGTAGTVNVADTSTLNAATLYVGNFGIGTVNQSGGTVTTNTLNMAYNAGTQGTSLATYNLGNGVVGSTATLVTTGIVGHLNATYGYGTINFNGGTLTANGSSTLFTNGPLTMNVLAGGATFNTNGYSDTVSQSFAAASGSAGGLTKAGAGTLTLSGSNTYAGPTAVAAGTLTAGAATALPSGTVLNVSGGATVNFNGQYAEPAGGPTAGLTLGGLNAAATSAFTFNVSGGSADDVAISGAANVAAGATINLVLPSGTAPTPGSYTLFTDATGAGGGLANFNISQSAIASGGTTYTLTLSATATADVLNIVMGSSTRYFYTGATDAVLSDPGNYALAANGSSPTTATPNAGIDVVFSAANVNAANTTVTLGSLAAVNSLEFSTATPITINGPGTLSLTGGALSFPAGTGLVIDAGAAAPTIAAGLSLPQQTTFINNATTAAPAVISGVIGGSGGLTLASTNASNSTTFIPGGAFNLSGANAYAGPTNVTTGAILIANTIGYGGSPSSVGASSNAPANLTLNNGQLVYAGGSAATDRGFTIAGTLPSVFNVSNAGTNLTFGGQVLGTSAILNKIGPGTLTLGNTAAGNTVSTNGGGLYIINGGVVLAGGTNNIYGTLRVGNNGQASDFNASEGSAFLNVSGGVTTVAGSFLVAENGGTGNTFTVNLLGGSTLNTTGTARTGNGATALGAGSAVFNIGGGSTYNSGTATFTLSNNGATAAANTVLNVGLGGSAGTIVTPVLAIGTGTATVNFDNGTFRAPVAGTTLAAATNLTVNVLAGGLTVDTQANSTTIGANLLAGPTAGGGLAKVGTGALTLAGNNTYTGGTTITAGSLFADTPGAGNSSTGTGGVTVAVGAKLAGNGYVGNATGPVVVNGTIGAGAINASVGTLNTAAETWAPGGSYLVKFTNGTGTAVGSTDTLVMTGLTITAGNTSAGQFVVNLANIGSGAIQLTAGQQVLIATDTNPATSPFTAALTSGSLVLGATPGITAVDALGLTTDPTGDMLYLSDVAAPEPTALLLAGLAATPLLVGRRGRRRVV